MSVIQRCRTCQAIISDDDNFTDGDDPEQCELCNEES
jgi:hypothetical protein